MRAVWPRARPNMPVVNRCGWGLAVTGLDPHSVPAAAKPKPIRIAINLTTVFRVVITFSFRLSIIKGPATLFLTSSVNFQNYPAIQSPRFQTVELPANCYGSMMFGLMKCIVRPPSIISSDEIMCGSNEAGLTTARITARSAGAVNSQVTASPRGNTTSHDFLITNRRGVGQELSLAAARPVGGSGAYTS